MDERLSATGAVWRGTPVDPAAAQRLVQELGIPDIVARILAGRGLTDPADAHRFLNPTVDQFHDPRLLPDYDLAVKEILGAKERGERIYVHGDYDVDGVTSAALLTRFLKKLGMDVVPHVPHRMKEGYGIHLDAVQWAKDQGSQLFLTCDCGIQAHDQIKAVNEAGMRAVVTDHHELGDRLPEAVAVVNPHRPESRYPFPEISGVGVAFKLCLGLSDELGINRRHYLRAYLDLAVMGTVADVMPLVDENRVITALGLPELRDSRKKGVQALLKVIGLPPHEPLTARHIGFQIGPRINAVGRIDDACWALDLLLTDDTQEAESLAQMLDQANLDRRGQQDAVLVEAIEQVEAMEGLPGALVVSGQAWHPGVVGIVAGKLVERYRRPTFVIAVGQDGKGRGSARSIEGYHLKDSIDVHMPMLLGGGGHAMAAGLSIAADRIPEFAGAVASHATSILRPEDLLPTVHYDAEATMEEAGPAGYAQAAQLEPFGNANPEPLWLVKDVEVAGIRPTRKPEHVILTLAQNGKRRKAMAFGIGESLQGAKVGDRLDVLVKMEVSTYNGTSEFRWTVVDHRPAG
ncbi:MAG: single-stranded-DNA-specific exonuclease RecJ [Fimbriimonadaceae bacterium]|nr:single-stranded-DNA-specific exonuclease RecJ [Fimbriimonadaceae bacterium]